MKSGLSNAFLRCAIYLTRSNRWQSKTFKTAFRKSSYDFRSNKYRPDKQNFLNMVQKETFEKCFVTSAISNMVLICSIYLWGSNRSDRKCLKWIFEKGHMKWGPSNMVLICSINQWQSNRTNSKMFRQTFQKGHMISSPSNIVLICIIY